MAPSVPVSRLLGLLVASLLARSSGAALTLSRYANTALAGTPLSVGALSSLEFGLANFTGSAEAVGNPAFPPLGYWRGYVWGPMAQLTYWSLRAYDHVGAARAGRKALCRQMTALMLSQWRAHRHICENFSPHRTADDSHGDCSGTKFYHWGALTGLTELVEEGYW